MKLRFLKSRTSRQLRHNNTQRGNMPYKRAQTVGVVFTVADRQKHDQIKDFIHKLEQDGKKVHVMSFLPEKRENHEFLFDFFTVKDVSFWGKITSQTAIKFCETPFDYLYYLDTEPNPYILYLLARSQAKCRVGRFWTSGEPYFELMLNSEASTRNLIEGVYKYSTQLK
ncbi:MAG: hypothetical protein HRU69_10940 [Flammeovirgaceae bacterium]|nr:MAG: hypothetical protein HRU69_10940 [Flammeovirgaceae bacterium]